MSPGTQAAQDDLLKSSFSSASSLVALQLFSRLFTFVLNQALFRLASPHAYGTIAIQFELMLNTVLFISREGVRNTLLRDTQPKSSSSNLSILPLFLGVPLALATSCLYAFSAGSDVRFQPNFNAAIGIYAFAAVTELMSEPLHNLAMAELRTHVRVKAEGLAITVKTLVTFLVLVYDTRRGESKGTLTLLAFAGGQMAYGITVLLTYLAYYWVRDARPETPRIKGWLTFDPESLRLALTMTSQSLVKLLLTEGDKLILSWFSPLQDQGGYALAVNYGSLIARVVFQPVEETSRIYFSKILSSTPSKSVADTPKDGNLRQAAVALISLLSVQSSMSVIILVFGTAYMPIVLHVLLPQQYLSTSASTVLSAWVWYIPVLAFNGGLEAFLSSVATPNDLNKQSRWMAGFSVIYILAAVILYALQLGDASLVYANILNLSVRIIYSTHFISSFFSSHNARDVLTWNKALPGWPVILTSGVSAAFVWISARRLEVLEAVKEGGRTALVTLPVMTHVMFGGVMGLSCLTVWWMSSGRYLSIPSRTKIE